MKSLKLSKQDKLTKLIELAEKNSYVLPDTARVLLNHHMVELSKSWVIAILMSHDFAKAIWTKPAPTVIHKDLGDTETYHWEPEWRIHLQRAVISNDPLEYYWENK